MKDAARDIEIFGRGARSLATTKTARERPRRLAPGAAGPAFSFQWLRAKGSVRPSAALWIASSITVITSMASCGLTGNGTPSRIDAASAR